MRKLLLATALLATMSAMADNAYELVVGADRTPMTDGQTLQMTPERNPWTKSKDQLLWEPGIFVKANVECTVTGSIQTIKGEWQYCFPNSCQQVPEGQTVTTSGKLEAGSFTNTQIHTTARIPKNGGYDEIHKAVFTTTGAGVTYTVNLETAPVAPVEDGIEETVVATDYVFCANNVLTYKVAAPAALTVYNIGGQAVASKKVSGEGSLDLNLPAGLYLYSVGNLSGKIVVK